MNTNERGGLSLVWFQPSLFPAPTGLRCQTVTGAERCEEFSAAMVTWRCPHRHVRRAMACEQHLADVNADLFCRTCRTRRVDPHQHCPLTLSSIRRRRTARGGRNR